MVFPLKCLSHYPSVSYEAKKGATYYVHIEDHWNILGGAFGDIVQQINTGAQN